MKKDTVLKVVSIILALVSILALICTVTVTGSGFLDLSNIVRGVCIGQPPTRFIFYPLHLAIPLSLVKFGMLCALGCPLFS